MEQNPTSPLIRQTDPIPPQAGHSRRANVLIASAVVLALAISLPLILFRVYGIDTHHEGRGGIWWPVWGRNLIPPTATYITLRRDALDHHAVYTVTEKDLNAFLNNRFARAGEILDSFRERSPASPELIGKEIGPFRWVITRDTVVYTYTAANGGAHSYYHDANTGRTYQSSAYW